MDPASIVSVTQDWSLTYPGAAIGLLILEGVNNLPADSRLERDQSDLEASLRNRFANLDRKALLELPVLRSYREYYKRFDKTYHVLLQLESVVVKGKSIPRSLPLVNIMFAIELQNLLLTAVHDLDRVALPLLIDIAKGHEIYQELRGETRSCKRGDMIMKDAEGVICSVIYGSDQKTKITSATRRALFVVYCPPGIDLVSIEEHLKDLENAVQRYSPKIKTGPRKIFKANEPDRR